jgi:hypothetical protein
MVVGFLALAALVGVQEVSDVAFRAIRRCRLGKVRHEQ